MNSYTLTAGEIGRLHKARQLQAGKARASYFKIHGYMPKASDPKCLGSVANVAFVNGSTVETALPLARVAEWAKTFDSGKVLEVEIRADQMTLRHAPGSFLRFHCYPGTVPAKEDFPREDLGAPLRVVAPAAGGAFAVESGDVDAEMRALRVTLGANRKDVAKRKAWGEAKRKEREALAALRGKAREAAAARKIFEGTKYADALALARRCLEALRGYRAALRYPKGVNLPGWMPEDFCGTFVELSVARSDAARAARDYSAPNRKGWGAPHETPKEKKLRLASEAAARAFATFVDQRFQDYCAALGLPHDLRWGAPRAFSIARNFISTWRAEKLRLGNLYREAILARKELDA